MFFLRKHANTSHSRYNVMKIRQLVMIGVCQTPIITPYPTPHIALGVIT